MEEFEEMASQGDTSNPESVEELTMMVKWSGNGTFVVRVCADDTVGELKRRICELTNVLPKRQKLLNVRVGATPAVDSMLLSQLNIKLTTKIVMMGTVEDEILVEPVDAPEVVDDFELGQEDTVDIMDREVNKQKLRRRIEQFKLNLINPPRPGKKCLVLDIDYTLFDHRSTAENPRELMRPYLHEFLTTAYQFYDVIIWSATSMKWVEVKMKELGVLSHPDYKITAMMDHLAMITVQSESHGVFDCKPLGVLWGKCPEFYNSKNTIMFDDLRRNFVMNPQNGLVIKPFRKAHINRASDQELLGLADYLVAISALDDLSELDHQRWKDYSDQHKRRRRS